MIVSNSCKAVCKTCEKQIKSLHILAQKVTANKGKKATLGLDSIHKINARKV